MMQSIQKLTALLLAAVALLISGCVFANPTNPVPGGTAPLGVATVPAPVLIPLVPQPGLTLTPGRLVAPVGKDVLLVAGVHVPNRPQAPFQRVEWMLTQPGVGNFLAVGQSDRPFLVGLFGKPPQKLDNNYAVTETAAVSHILTRGTVDPVDDVTITPGQAWVSLTSPVEGTSYVTAYAPDLQGNPSNRQTAVIQWVDARWRVEPITNAAQGSPAPITVTALRRSTEQPIAGWIVRYTISGGPAANFTAGGAQTVEVLTDTAGRATVDLSQAAPQIGTNAVTINLIRPADPGRGEPEPVTIGTTAVQVVWNASASVPISSTPINPAPSIPITPNPAPSPTVPNTSAPVTLKLTSLARSGPVGQPVRFEIDITNVSDKPITNLVIEDQLDEGWHFAKWDTEGRFNPIRRQVVPSRSAQSIEPGKTLQTSVDLRPDRAGELCHTVSARVDGIAAVTTLRICYTAIQGAGGANPGTGAQPGAGLPPAGASAGGIDSQFAQYTVTVSGPREQLQMGETVIYRINVENKGDTPLSNVKVFAKFAPEFRFEAASYQEEQYKFTRPIGEPNSLEWTFPIIEARKSLKEPIQVQVNCVRTTAPNTKAFVQVRASDSKTAIGGDTSATIVNTQAAPPSSRSKTSLQLFPPDAQASVQVGRTRVYTFVLTNEGSEPDRNLRLSIQLPQELECKQQDINAQGLKPSIKNENGIQFIDFEPIPELKPKGTVQVFLKTTAVRINPSATVSGSFMSEAHPQGSAAQPNTVQIYNQ